MYKRQVKDWLETVDVLRIDASEELTGKWSSVCDSCQERLAQEQAHREQERQERERREEQRRQERLEEQRQAERLEQVLQEQEQARLEQVTPPGEAPAMAPPEIKDDTDRAVYSYSRMITARIWRVRDGELGVLEGRQDFANAVRLNFDRVSAEVAISGTKSISQICLCAYCDPAYPCPADAFYIPYPAQKNGPYY